MLFWPALCLSPALGTGARAEDQPPAWVGAMRQTHEKFQGTPGTVALVGDSITVSLAFWAPLQEERPKASKRFQKDWKLAREYQRPECWRDWRGPEFGNNGRMTAGWGAENIEAWLANLKPEVAIVMFGSNDVSEVELETYAANMRKIVEPCLANGTVVLLTSMPPRHGLEEKSAAFAEAVRKLAVEFKLPLIDYHAEVLKRRPDDWDGALAKFADAPGDEYQVPTLISRDGVHPSNPSAHQDYSEEDLSRNGFALRNALTLASYAEVIRRVLKTD
jgi:hypothetical protein